MKMRASFGGKTLHHVTKKYIEKYTEKCSGKMEAAQMSRVHVDPIISCPLLLRRQISRQFLSVNIQLKVIVKSKAFVKDTCLRRRTLYQFVKDLLLVNMTAYTHI